MENIKIANVDYKKVGILHEDNLKIVQSDLVLEVIFVVKKCCAKTYFIQ